MKKPRGKAKLQEPAEAPDPIVVRDEVLAEGSGPVGAVVHVGIDTIGTAAGDDENVATSVAPAEDGAVDTGAESGEPIDRPGSEADGAIEMEAAVDGADLDGSDGRLGGDAELCATLPTSAASMDATQLKHLVEALVFAADKPITVARLRQLTRVGDTRRLEQALAELATDYAERGLTLQQVSGGYQFRTRTQFSGWVQQLIAGRPVRLSRAQLETLAIIAYRQPITRPEIDDIRGVDSSQTLKLLIDRALIRILGKKEEVGRPMLYGTTREFLDFFSLGDLRELPTLREYSELSDESRKVMSDRLGLGMGDEADDGLGLDDGELTAEPNGESGGAPRETSLDELLAAYAESTPPDAENVAENVANNVANNVAKNASTVPEPVEAAEAVADQGPGDEDLDASGCGVDPAVVPSTRAADDDDPSTFDR